MPTSLFYYSDHIYSIIHLYIYTNICIIGLTILTLWFWLFVATPVPLKIEVVNEDPLLYTFNSKSEAYSSTVWSIVKNKK